MSGHDNLTNMKYLGIDYGLKRVGLAISEGNLASPFKVIEVNGLKDAIEKIKNIIYKEEINQVVLGKPEGDMGKMVDNFKKELQKYSGTWQIVLADETLSTKSALSDMIELGVPMKKRQINDSYAAALILQNYLDDHE
jgi:putative holliday junction resolvase